MCLILFAYRVHKSYPLIVASNRDEFFQRPTQQAGYWEDQPEILAGRDLEHGGTWMGLSKSGKFSALTNFRDPHEQKENARSRGEIVTNYLLERESTKNYITTLMNKRDEYRGFNAIFKDKENLYYYSNVQNKLKKLKPGLYGLSNHFLDTPWPKVKKGKKNLQDCLENEFIDKECLFQLLSDNQPIEDSLLPNTGVGIEWERVLSPLFIKSTKYGTRASTILLMDDKGYVQYTERTFINTDYNDLDFSFHIL